jgi:hypothetical protein
MKMANGEQDNLLRSARSLLDRFMFEGDELRDDVADLSIKIDEAVQASAEVSVPSAGTEEMINVAA